MFSHSNWWTCLYVFLDVLVHSALPRLTTLTYSLGDFVPDDGVVVQLKLFCIICCFAHFVTLALWFSGQFIYIPSSIFILEPTTNFTVMKKNKNFLSESDACNCLETNLHLFHYVERDIDWKFHVCRRHLLQHRSGSPQQCVAVIRVQIFTLCGQRCPGQRGHECLHVTHWWLLTRDMWQEALECQTAAVITGLLFTFLRVWD